MSVPRCYVDEELHEGKLLTLPPNVQHHLVSVLRRAAGDPLVLFNGRGGEYTATLDSAAKRSAGVRLGEFRDVDRESPLAITLAQGVSKGERMDYTVQKAVELGVAEIVPLLTDHSVVKLSDERWQRKQEHWQAIAVSACEQSGRTRVPTVTPVVDLRDWLPACPQSSLKLVLAPGAEAPPAGVGFSGQPIVLLVGPEGGLSELEIKLAELAGYAGLSLGPRVLRTETAGVVALSVVQALWGDVRPSLEK
jgi:16S rRNA (uracil1498-N3)-methyltransferase